MILFFLVLAPAVMALAAIVERRLGPSAAGWVAALPVAFAVAVLAVTLDAGEGAASAMALSAASHVPAQVLFAVVFATLLMRRGLWLGIAAGAAAYGGGALMIAEAPAALAVVGAIVVLAVAPLLMADGRPRPASPRRWYTTALTCVVAGLIVGAAVVTTRWAGPDVAGALAAFPTMSITLAVAVVVRDGAVAGAHSLNGLVRSLPCYLTFCLVIAAAAPSAGVRAIPLALLACLATAAATWRGVAVVRQPALAR